MSKINSLEVVTWSDVKLQVKKINPWFYNEAEDVKGIDNFKLIKVTYPYGADIIKRGEFQLNIEGNITPFSELSKNSKIAKLLQYRWSTIPFGIISKNTAESHMAYTSKVMPFMLQRPGQLFSLLSIFDDKPHPYFVPELYSTKSGCRSLILLPSTKDAIGNKRLVDRLNIPDNLTPNDLLDQWELLEHIINSTNTEIEWSNEILFFSKDFVDLNNDTVWFNRSLLYRIWNATDFERFSYIHEMIWSTFLLKQPLVVRNDAETLHIAKQLFNIALGEAPGYIPATSNISGPVSELIDVFLNIYKIRFHLPVFMELCNYSGKLPVYYSLQKPTFFYETVKKATTKQTVKQLKALKQLMDNFCDFVIDKKFHCDITNTPLYNIINSVKFDFFHPKSDTDDINGDILELIDEDNRFSNMPYKGELSKDLSFPIHSLFFHGCIRISNK